MADRGRGRARARRPGRSTALLARGRRRLPEVYRKIATTLVVGALAALAVGWLQPAPWVLALLLSAILVLVWLVAIGRFLRAHAWSEADAESNQQAHGAAS